MASTSVTCPSCSEPIDIPIVITTEPRTAGENAGSGITVHVQLDGTSLDEIIRRHAEQVINGSVCALTEAIEQTRVTT